MDVASGLEQGAYARCLLNILSWLRIFQALHALFVIGNARRARTPTSSAHVPSAEVEEALGQAHKRGRDMMPGLGAFGGGGGGAFGGGKESWMVKEGVGGDVSAAQLKAWRKHLERRNAGQDEEG